jgi:hypothetical protein
MYLLRLGHGRAAPESLRLPPLIAASTQRFPGPARS